MTTDNQPSRYTISGVMADGAPYTADGTVQPDGAVLFRVPHLARVKDCSIDYTGKMPTEFIIEKAAG